MADTEAPRRLSNPSLWEDISALLDLSFVDGETAVTSTGEKKTLKKGVELRLRKLKKEGQARWRKLVTGNENTRIRDHIGQARDRLREKSQRKAREMVTGNAEIAIEDHLKTTPVVKWIDKLSFTVGIFCFGITEFIVLKRPEIYWVWFSTIMFALLSFRIYSYSVKRWGFFMFDFCYYAVITTMAYTIFYPHNVMFGQINFMFCNGPLMVAILAWRNSLVFHSLDKMTSISIHSMGALLTFLARWHPQGRNIMCDERLGAGNITAECSSLNITSAVVWPIVGYVVWQLLQIFLTEIVFSSMITNDMTLQTSIRWLCKDKRNAMHQIAKSICRATGIFARTETFDGEAWKSKLIFWTMQLLYTVVTLLPGIIVYHSYWLHVAWLLVVMWSLVWNGASYYIEVFASRYVLQFGEEIGEQSSGSSGYVDPDALPLDTPGIPTPSSRKKGKEL
jgi:hypothetical protein